MVDKPLIISQEEFVIVTSGNHLIYIYEDMASSWKQGLTLDRIDNDGNYSKENCRWADRKTQNNNTRRNRYITINGVTKTLSEWCEHSSLKSSTIRQRYYVYKWSIEKSLGFNN